jgi:hypothetical protein
LRVNQELLRFLQANTANNRYMLVVPSAMEGDAYVIATGRPVLYAGGFNGGDPVISADDLARLAAQGQVRYVLWGERPQGQGRNTGSAITAYLQAHGTPIPGFGQPGDGPPDRPGLLTLYDLRSR